VCDNPATREVQSPHGEGRMPSTRPQLVPVFSLSLICLISSSPAGYDIPLMGSSVGRAECGPSAELSRAGTRSGAVGDGLRFGGLSAPRATCTQAALHVHQCLCCAERRAHLDWRQNFWMECRMRAKTGCQQDVTRWLLFSFDCCQVQISLLLEATDLFGGTGGPKPPSSVSEPLS
jgi:hypothetical protein